MSKKKKTKKPELTQEKRISIKKTAAVGFTESSLMKTIADNGGEVSYVEDKGEVKEVYYTPPVSGGAWC